MNRLTVVIPNFNYGEFVASAIESALAVSWHDLEVIVVDDGSTDDSREVIRGYADRITVIEQENAGPREACNAGYAVSTGDVIIFLDSDDVLAPSIATEVEAVWSDDISKVQVQMRRIDRRGNPSGTVFPEYRFTPTSSQIEQWMEATTSYPTPPGSGNAYARTFLEKLFPLDDRCGDATDSACLAAAPYLGNVITVAKPLVDYRVHGNNRSDLMVDPVRFTKQVKRAVQRHRFAMEVTGRVLDRRTMAPLFRSRHLLQLRVAEKRLCGGPSPVPGDGLLRMLRDSVTSVFAPGPESVSKRLLIGSWSIATALAPRPVAVRLIRARFSHPVGI